MSTGNKSNQQTPPKKPLINNYVKEGAKLSINNKTLSQRELHEAVNERNEATREAALNEIMEAQKSQILAENRLTQAIDNNKEQLLVNKATLIKSYSSDSVQSVIKGNNKKLETNLANELKTIESSKTIIGDIVKRSGLMQKDIDAQATKIRAELKAREEAAKAAQEAEAKKAAVLKNFDAMLQQNGLTREDVGKIMKTGESEASEQANTQLRDENKALNTKNAELEAKITEQNGNNTLNDLKNKKEIENLKKQLEAAQKDNEKLNETILTKTSERLTEALQYSGAIEDLKQQLANAQKDNKTLKADNEKTKGELDTVKQESEKTKEELDTLKIESEKIQKALQTERDDGIIVFKYQKQELEDNNRELQKNALIAQIKNQTIQKENTELKAENTQTKEELNTVKQESEKTKEELQSVKGELEAAKKENTELKAENTQTKEELNTVKQESEKTKGELDTVKQESEKTKEELQSVKGELDTVKNERDQLKATIKNTEEGKNQEIEQLKQQLADMKKERDQLKDSVDNKNQNNNISNDMSVTGAEKPAGKEEQKPAAGNNVAENTQTKEEQKSAAGNNVAEKEEQKPAAGNNVAENTQTKEEQKSAAGNNVAEKEEQKSAAGKPAAENNVAEKEEQKSAAGNNVAEKPKDKELMDQLQQEFNALPDDQKEAVKKFINDLKDPNRENNKEANDAEKGQHEQNLLNNYNQQHGGQSQVNNQNYQQGQQNLGHLGHNLDQFNNAQQGAGGFIDKLVHLINSMGFGEIVKQEFIKNLKNQIAAEIARNIQQSRGVYPQGQQFAQQPAQMSNMYPQGQQFQANTFNYQKVLSNKIRFAPQNNKDLKAIAAARIKAVRGALMSDIKKNMITRKDNIKMHEKIGKDGVLRRIISGKTADNKEFKQTYTQDKRTGEFNLTTEKYQVQATFKKDTGEKVKIFEKTKFELDENGNYKDTAGTKSMLTKIQKGNQTTKIEQALDEKGKSADTTTKTITKETQGHRLMGNKKETRTVTKTVNNNPETTTTKVAVASITKEGGRSSKDYAMITDVTGTNRVEVPAARNTGAKTAQKSL